MAQFIILLGGNIGNVKATFQQAIRLLTQELGELKTTSSLYRSEAWGFKSDDDFLNQVVVLDSSKSPFEVLSITQNIEIKLGRSTKSTLGYQSRLIDIDILFIDNLIIRTENLTVPHPQLHLRRFALEPLMELCPNRIHSELHKSILDLYRECPDKSVVLKQEKEN